MTPFRSRIQRTVKSNGLYLDSAMDMYSLRAIDTSDIQNVFILSLSSAEKFRVIIQFFFPVSFCRPNYQGFVIEQHCGEIMQWDRNK